MRLVSLGGLLTLVLAFPATRVSAENHPTTGIETTWPVTKNSWTEVKSRNFLVVGDGDGKQLRKIAVDLEEIRRQFLTVLPKGTDSGVRTTVVAFRNEKSFTQFRRLGIAHEEKTGYVQAGVDRNYIVINADEKHRRSVYHDYIRLLIRPLGFPVWLREGLSEYYGSVENERYLVGEYRTVLIGFPIYDYEKFLKDRSLLSLEELFAVNDESPSYEQNNRRNVFIAESWALVHMMHSVGSADLLKQMLLLLVEGKPAREAFREAFRANPELIEQGLRDYIQTSKSGGWSYRRIPYCMCESGPNDWLQFNFDSIQTYAKENERKLDGGEVRFHLGDLMLHRGMVAEAEVLLESALALNPDFAPTHASLGVLRMQQGRVDQAKTSINRALALGSDNPLPYFWFAQLMQEGQQKADWTREQLQNMQTALFKAVRFGPHLDEAAEMLSEVNVLLGEPEQNNNIIRRPSTGLLIGSKPGR